MDDINPILAKIVEEAILFGKVNDLDAILGTLRGRDDVTDELRCGLEALRHFRAHYASDEPEEALPLSGEARAQVIRYDADWSMQLIQFLHRRCFGVPAKKRA